MFLQANILTRSTRNTWSKTQSRILVIHLLTKARTVCIGYKHIVGEAVVKPVRKVEELGKKQFYDYVEKRLKQKKERSL